MMTALDANTGKSAAIEAAVKSRRFHIAPRLHDKCLHYERRDSSHRGFTPERKFLDALACAMSDRRYSCEIITQSNGRRPQWIV